MDILADTGVILRFMEPSDPVHPIMVRAVRTLRARGDRLIITPQNSAEFWNICTRPKSSRGGMGLGLRESDRRLRQIEVAFPMLFEDRGAYAIWRTLIPSMR